MSTTHPFERMRAHAANELAEVEFEREYGRATRPTDRRFGHRIAHKPQLNLADFKTGSAQPPAAVHRKSTAGLGTLMNDTLGDCGPAMAIHGNGMFHRDAGTPVPAWGDQDAEVFYEEEGGYNPDAPLVDGVNPTDQGSDNNVLVGHWQDPGILCHADGTRHKIAASLFVEPTEEMTKLAIWEFVVCFRAYGLPVTAENQTHWTVVDDGNPADSEVGSLGYHDIPLCSYGPWNVGLITWGQPWMASWEFDKRYAVQSFVVVTEEQLNLQGVSPAGIDWTALNAAIKSLPPASN